MSATCLLCKTEYQNYENESGDPFWCSKCCERLKRLTSGALDNPYPSVKVGAIIEDGYCQGYFDSDSYESKRIIALGYNWVVAQGLDYEGRDKGLPSYACGDRKGLYSALEKAINYKRKDE